MLQVFPEVEVLLMESTRTRLTPQAWHYLWSNGYKTTRDPAVGYPMLTFLAPQPRRGQEQLCVDVTVGLRAENVYAGDIQSIGTNH